MTVRRTVFAFMIKDYKERIIKLDKPEAEKQEMLKNYIKNNKYLSEEGEWVDDIFIQSAARCYKRPILLMGYDFSTKYMIEKRYFEAYFNDDANRKT